MKTNGSPVLRLSIGVGTPGIIVGVFCGLKIKKWGESGENTEIDKKKGIRL